MRITVRTVEKKYPVEYIREAKRVPLCTECNAPIRPGVCLMGEKVDNKVITKAADEVQKADVLLVLGTNLKTYLCTQLINYGGDKSDYTNCHELFEAMGTNINYEGSAGCGQHCKLANQIMIAGALSGVCEALTYAKEKGLDLNVFSKSVATGAAGSRQFDLFGPKIIEKDYAPGFFMKHFIKDMKLALIEANRSGLNLEVLSQVLAIYEELEADGNGDLGTQALIKYYE